MYILRKRERGRESEREDVDKKREMHKAAISSEVAPRKSERFLFSHIL
jgi:hypothetical protein